MKRVELIKGVDKRLALKTAQKLEFQPQARGIAKQIFWKYFRNQIEENTN